MQKCLLVLLILLSAALAIESLSSHHKKNREHGPARWSAETSFYLGPAAGKCPYADSHFGGAVAFDYEGHAARFDTRWNTKGAKPHTVWVFKNDETINFFYYDRAESICKTHNKTFEHASEDRKVELSYKSKYSIGSQMVEFFSFKSGDYRAMVSITAQGRLPVRSIGTQSNSLLYSVDYLSPHYGFNPFTFDLPAECQASNAQPMEKDDGFILLAEGYYMMHRNHGM